MPVPDFAPGEILTAQAMDSIGLWRITTCTVTSVGGTAATASNGVITVGSGNTSLKIQNAFSTNYDAYKVVMSNLDGSTGTSSLIIQLVDSSGTAATTNYSQTGFFMSYASTTVNGYNNPDWATSLSATNFGGSFEVYNPFLTVASYFNTTAADDSFFRVYAGKHTTASSYTGFQLAPNSGSLNSGTIRVYGYRN